MQIIHDLDQIAPALPLPPKYILPQLALTLSNHHSLVCQPSTSLGGSIHVAHIATACGNSSAPPSAARGDRPPPDRGRRDRRSQDRPPDRSRSRSTSRTRPPPNTTVPQCAACCGNGHTVQECRFLPKWANCMRYSTAHPTDTRNSGRQFQRNQHPDTYQQDRTRLVHALRHVESDTIANLLTTREIDTIAQHLSASSYYHTSPLDVADDAVADDSHMTNLANSCRTSVTPTHAGPFPDLELHSTIHSVKFPPADMIGHLSPSSTDFHRLGAYTQRITTTRVHHAGIHLADTGVTVSATGMRDLLHDFTPTTSYEITGYDGVATPAHGQGYDHVRNPLDGQVERIFFVYTPTVTGTIISLENHAKLHPRIHR